MSLREFERLEGPEEVELLIGELIQMPVPKRRHMRTYSTGSARRIWRSRDRKGASRPSKQLVNLLFRAHLVVFEVVSKSNSAGRLDEKVAEYLSHGSQEVWVIYPDSRHALVYRQGTVRLETQAIRSNLLPEIEIPLDQVL